jgi:hypothetical protein
MGRALAVFCLPLRLRHQFRRKPFALIGGLQSSWTGRNLDPQQSGVTLDGEIIMSRSANDDRSDSMNPNNDAYDDSMDNHSDQLNPNNDNYQGSREDLDED